MKNNQCSTTDNQIEQNNHDRKKEKKEKCYNHGEEEDKLNKWLIIYIICCLENINILIILEEIRAWDDRTKPYFNL